MNFFGRLRVATFTILTAISAHAIESVDADHIRVSILAPKSFSTLTPTKFGVLFEPAEGWHVYWKNPGDSGSAPKFEFKSSGFEKISEPLWPSPHRIPFGPLTNLGYEGSVAILFDAKSDGKPRVKVEAALEWLVCKEECIPGFATLTFERPATDQANWDESTQKIIHASQSKLPLDGLTSRVQIAKVTFDSKRSQVYVETEDELAEVELYPVGGDFIQAGAPVVADKSFTFQTLPGAKAPKTTDFVVVVNDKAYELKALPVEVAEANTEPADFSTLALLLLSAFIGGLILNLMPCVFPVLSIKIFSLMKTGESHAREGLMYTFGVLVTFAALGAAFLILRQAGQSIGWGFQLQSPAIVLALAALFWMMALNFLGVFEFGERIMNIAGNQKSNSSFATGVLAVFIAAPCTGPFMGTALGAAISLPAYQAMSIFIGLGLGLASPFLLIASSPKLARLLPKPGAWMETVKHFFAFPLFATVIWLLWVLGLQTGTEGWVAAAILLFTLSFSVWLGKSRGRVAKTIAALLVVAAAVYSIQEVRSASSPVTIVTDRWKPFDQAIVDQAVVAKQPVFIDFTAAWCITCQVNKKVVLRTAAVEKIFADNGVLTLQADWTKYDPRITEALARFGRSSVPVYAFYPAGQATPQILPQILSASIIENLFSPQEVEK